MNSRMKISAKKSVDGYLKFNMIRRNMRYLIGGFLLVIVGLGGCRSLANRTSGESKVDIKLSESSPSLPAPQAAPSEPQPGFEQESPRSQNL